MLAIAALTLHEASRRRVVLAALAMGLALVALTGWGFWKLKITAASHNGDPAVVAATIAIFVVMLAYMFSVALAIGAAFLAAPALASDVESGVLLAILPRPIRRADVVLGKWIGLTSLVVSLVVAIGGAELIVVKLVTHYAPPHPATALAYLCGESAILLTLALALSTRFPPIASGIVAIALFGLAWIAGIAAVAASALSNATLLHAGTVISLLVPSDGLWRGALAALEPVVFQLASGSQGTQSFGPFAVTGPPAPAFLFWSAAWIAIVLGLATVSFRRRDV